MISHLSKPVHLGNKACYAVLLLKRSKVERHPLLQITITIIPTFVIVAIIAGLPIPQEGSRPFHVERRKMIFARYVGPGIGENTFSCAVFTAALSLRVSRYATRLVHTTMGMALFAHPTNSSHFAHIVAVLAGALLKIPVLVLCGLRQPVGPHGW